MEVQEETVSHEFRHPACEYVGLTDEGETVAFCGRPALGVIADRSGGRHFACAEHVSEMKARYGTGAWALRPPTGSSRPFPEAVP